jgi:hypothetical protein
MEWIKVPSIINLAKNITPDGVEIGSIHYKSGKKHHSGWSGKRFHPL